MTPQRMHSGLSGCSKPHFGQIMPVLLPSQELSRAGVSFHAAGAALFRTGCSAAMVERAGEGVKEEGAGATLSDERRRTVGALITLALFSQPPPFRREKRENCKAFPRFFASSFPF